MSIDYGFSTDDISVEDGLPVGKYKVMITEAEPKTSRTEERGLQLTYEVVDGDHKGQNYKEWFNLWHSKSDTAEWARKRFARVAKATGKVIDRDNPPDGRLLVITVAQDDKNPEYTKIAKYEPSDTPF